MNFVVTAPVTPADELAIDPGPFWPDIEPSKIREAQRIDGTVTPERLREALIDAIASVNGELAAWRETQQAAGRATLADVPAEEIDGESILLHRYRRAVGCLAKAGVLERYRDFDATQAGDQKAERLADPIEDLRRDARWAISAILGIGRTTVELI